MAVLSIAALGPRAYLPPLLSPSPMSWMCLPGRILLHLMDSFYAVWAAVLMVVDYEEFAVLAVGYPEWLARFPRRGPMAHRATPAGVVAALRMS